MATTEPLLNRVLITGAGPVTVLGLGMDAMLEGISSAEVLVGEAGFPTLRRPFVPEFDLQNFIETKRPYLDPQTRCALVAAALALQSAGFQRDEVDAGRFGLSFATAFGCLDTQMLFQSMVNEKGMRLGSPVLFSCSYPNTTNSIVSIEFSLKGYNQNFCGDILCGAQALEAAYLAVRGGRADLMLAGGADVVGPAMLDRLRAAMCDNAPPPAQGACFLLVEAQDAAERREAYALCELASVVCIGTGHPCTVHTMAEALRAAWRRALQEAGIWEGDVGIVFVSTAASIFPKAQQVEKQALEPFSQVPTVAVKRFIGETFGAGFALECVAAADVLDTGLVPPKVSFFGKTGGVEFWVERQREPLMGDAALVLGCTPGLATAAVLRSL